MGTLLVLLGRQDERMLHALVLRRRALLDRTMRLATHAGDAWVAISVVLMLVAGVVPGLERAGYEAAFAMSASHLWVQILKRSITRPRPRLPVGCASLIDVPDRFSFPSGHAAAALSLALPLATVLPLTVATGALALAVLVGISRCYLGVHYPGDVLMGWMLASLAAWMAEPALAGLLS